MQSKITIEVDFENGNEPVIQIISRNTDDIRDKLIRFFIERLGHSSSWCKIYCQQAIGQEESEDRRFQRWKISPITPAQLKQEGVIMLNQHKIESPQASDIEDNRPQIIKDIVNIMYTVEGMGADTNLTHASIHLSKTKEFIQNFLDKK